MKKVSTILLSWVIVTALLFSGTAYAQIEEELPNPGITPDSPFYFVDIWGKKIGLFFAFGAEAKAKKALQYAEERLAEAQAMADKNKPQAVTVATGGYDEYVTMAIGKMGEAKNKGVDISEVSEIAALATSNHLLVWDGVEDIVPAEAQEAITQAKEVSINGLGNALRLLAGENPVRAIEINLATIEDTLNSARANAEDNDIEGLEDDLDDFVALNAFGVEISKIARGLSDNRTVDELVAKATGHHLDVLALVLGKVPEQATAAIEMAIEVSVRGHERAVEVLKEKGALPKGISDDVTKGIPDEVREKLKLGVLENDEEAPGRGRGQRP